MTHPGSARLGQPDGDSGTRTDDMERTGDMEMARLRIGLGAAGAILGLAGVWFFVTGVPTAQWPGVFIWLGAVVIAHDAVIAPAAVLVGLALFAVLPGRLRKPMRMAALAFASVTLIRVPLLMTRRAASHGGSLGVSLLRQRLTHITDDSESENGAQRALGDSGPDGSEAVASPT